MTVRDLYEWAKINDDCLDREVYVMFDDCFWKTQSITETEDEFGKLVRIRVSYANPR